MDASLIRIKELLISKNLFENPIVSKVGTGEAHNNFVAVEKDKKLVIRTLRTDIPINRSFENEHVQLKFLQEEGIKFAPKSVYFDKEKEIHIISFIQGSDYSIANLPINLLPAFIRQLFKIETLSFNNFKKVCKRNAFKTSSPQTTKELFQKIGHDWFNVLKEHKEKRGVEEIIRWVEPKFDYIENEISRNIDTLRFKHGDLRWHPNGGNLRLRNSHLSFIDWESAGFANDSLLEIGDVIASIPEPNNEQERIDSLINEYAKVAHRKTRELKSQLEFSIRLSKLSDVLWSAQRYLRLKDKKIKGWVKYREMTNYRMKAGDYYFRNSNLFNY